MAKAIDRTAQGRADRERRRTERRNAPAELRVGADLTPAQRKARERARDALEYRDPPGTALRESYRKAGAGAPKGLGRSVMAPSRGSRTDAGDVGGFERRNVIERQRAAQTGQTIRQVLQEMVPGQKPGTLTAKQRRELAVRFGLGGVLVAAGMPSHETGVSPLGAARTNRLAGLTVKQLRAEAKAAGVKGTAKMNRATLTVALTAKLGSTGQPKTRAQMRAGRKNGPIPVRTGRLVAAMMGRASILSATAGSKASGSGGTNADGGK